MRNWICLLMLAIGLLGALPASAGERASLEGTLHFGYSLRDGAVAIDPAVVYVYCPATETLVVHPDHQDEAASDLEAEILSSGEWFIPGGQLVTPQIAKQMIATPDSHSAFLKNLGVLEVTSLDQVAVAVIADPACQTKLTGFKCTQVDCTGCREGAKYSGGAMSGCEHTGNQNDTCTQTGTIKTCNVTVYQNKDCTGAVISTSATNMNVCS